MIKRLRDRFLGQGSDQHRKGSCHAIPASGRRIHCRIQSQGIPGALACFTDDAIYQDVTYGTHSGQDELKKMLERMFLEADACWKAHTWVADARRRQTGPSIRHGPV